MKMLLGTSITPKKKEILKYLNIKNAYGNKAFLKTKRPSFSGKKLNSNTIMMLIGKIVYFLMTNKFRKSLITILIMEITTHLNLEQDIINQSQVLAIIIDSFKNHESIRRIKMVDLIRQYCYVWRLRKLVG